MKIKEFHLPWPYLYWTGVTCLFILCMDSLKHTKNYQTACTCTDYFYTPVSMCIRSWIHSTRLTRDWLALSPDLKLLAWPWGISRWTLLVSLLDLVRQIGLPNNKGQISVWWKIAEACILVLYSCTFLKTYLLAN